MPADKNLTSCIVCNSSGAEPGEYCEKHREELHRLDHRFETFLRLVRTARGKDHETYELFLREQCDPCGRVMVSETDPENLFITILLTSDFSLEEPISEYRTYKIDKSYGALLREKVEKEIIQGWYGNARACVDVFRILAEQPQHWDIDPRAESGEDAEEGPEPHLPQGGKHSIH